MFSHSRLRRKLSPELDEFHCLDDSSPGAEEQVLKEFWYGGEKIYEVYEIDRSPRRIAIRHVAP